MNEPLQRRSLWSKPVLARQPEFFQSGPPVAALGLPLDMKALGKEHVKGEFRRLKTFGTDMAQCFLQKWETYTAVLWQQAKENRQNSTEKACFGTILPEENLNDFHAEQIGQ